MSLFLPARHINCLFVLVFFFLGNLLAATSAFSEKRALVVVLPSHMKESKLAESVERGVEFVAQEFPNSFKILPSTEFSEKSDPSTIFAEWRDAASNLQFVVSLLPAAELERFLPLAEKEKIFLISAQDCSPLLQKSQATFCPFPSKRRQVELMLDVLRTQRKAGKTTSVLALVEEEEFFQHELKFLAAYAQKHGWTLPPHLVPSEMKTIEISQLAEKLKKKMPEVVFFAAGRDESLRTLFSVSNELDLRAQAGALCGPFVMSELDKKESKPDFLILAPEPALSPVYIQKFEDEMKRAPNMYSAVLGEILRYLVAADELAPTNDHAAIRKALGRLVLPRFAVQDFQFDEKGRVKFPLQPQILRRDKPREA